jgi:hypothetical protein
MKSGQEEFEAGLVAEAKEKKEKEKSTVAGQEILK